MNRAELDALIKFQQGDMPEMQQSLHDSVRPIGGQVILASAMLSEAFLAGFRAAVSYRDGLATARQSNGQSPDENPVRTAKTRLVNHHETAYNYDQAYNCSRSQYHVSAFPAVDRVRCPECRGSYILANPPKGESCQS